MERIRSHHHEIGPEIVKFSPESLEVPALPHFSPKPLTVASGSDQWS